MQIVILMEWIINRTLIGLVTSPLRDNCGWSLPEMPHSGIAVHWSIEEPYLRFGIAAKASGWSRRYAWIGCYSLQC